MSYESELRLLWAVLLNGAVLAAGACVARRVAADGPFARAVDALLFWLAVQYVAVTLPGAAGLLSAASMTAVALALSGGAVLAARRAPAREASAPWDGAALAAAALVAGALVAVARVLVWPSPVLGSDALTYHVPAAAEWLQTGRVGAFVPWHYAPANGWGPLGGSAFVAWWYAPAADESLARLYALPALLLLGAATARLAVLAGARPAVAALVGAAVVLARPNLGALGAAKDDGYVAAFAVAAACALAEPRGSAARAGVAVGLLLATKLTAALAAPALVLALGGQRWEAKRWALAAGVALAFTGPWYARNLVLTGNPVFPTRVLGLPGLFESRRAAEFESLSATWRVLVGGYYSLPALPTLALAALWLAAGAVVIARKQSGPAARVALLGPVVNLTLWWAVAPFSEERFVLTAYALAGAAGAVALSVLPAAPGVALAAALAMTMALTAFESLALLAPTFAVVTILVVAFALAWRRWADARPWLALGGAFALAGWAFVAWHAGASAVAETRHVVWRDTTLGAEADVIARLDELARPGDAVAYANAYLLYPLQGWGGARPLTFVPPNPRVRTQRDFAPAARPLRGRETNRYAQEQVYAGADWATWPDRVRASGARWLYVARRPINYAGDDLPGARERAAAAARPDVLELVGENDAASLYRVRR